MILANQVALITGASTGIGRATAEAMARQDAYVAVNYCNNKSGAEEAVQRICAAGSRAISVQADVTDCRDVQNMIDEVEKTLGPIDILVNNAGDLLAARGSSHSSRNGRAAPEYRSA